MSPKKVIYNNLDLHGLENKRIGMGLTFDQEVMGMTGKKGINTWGLAGLVEDLVGDVFGAVFVLENVAAMAKDSALFQVEPLHLG